MKNTSNTKQRKRKTGSYPPHMTQSQLAQPVPAFQTRRRQPRARGRCSPGWCRSSYSQQLKQGFQSALNEQQQKNRKGNTWLITKAT